METVNPLSVVMFIVGLFSLISVIVYSIIMYKKTSDFETLLIKQQQQKPPTPIFKVDLRQTEEMIKQIPNKVLQSIHSSANGYKGNIGELIGFLKLNAEYDRIIVLGDIVDYIGITYEKEDSPGKITFIDIKTGKAKLSKDQRLLKQIIEHKNIEFQKYNISISNLINKDGTNE